MFRLLIVLLAAAAAGPAAPRAWVKAKSSNFELFTNAGEKKAKEAILHFEQVRGFFLKLNPDYQSGVPVRIVGFNSQADYKPYTINETAAAYYSGGRDRDYIVMSSLGSEDYPVAVHEYVHLLLKPAGPHIPAWLNEGLAELYSTLKPLGGKVQIGNVIPGRLHQLQTNRWLDPAALFGTQRGGKIFDDRDRGGMFYAQSWGLVHMLVLSKEYNANFSKAFAALLEGQDANDAFTAAYGRDVAEIWKAFDAYVRRGEFNIGVFSVKLEKSAETPEIAPATEAESRIVLASLLEQTGREAEASRAYWDLARDYPEDAGIQEGLAYIALRKQSLDDARKYFARSVELGTGNAQVYLDYANLGGTPEMKVKLLRKAVELRPDFVDAQYALGFALMGENDFVGAVRTLSAIRKIDEKRAYSFFSGIAYAQLRLGNKEEVKIAAGRALKYAGSYQERRSVEHILKAAEDPEPATERSVRVQQDEDSGRPRLARSGDPQPKVWEASAPPTIEGLLSNFECLGTRARIRVLASGREVRLAIPDPGKVVIRGPSGTVEFVCGAQKPPKSVRVEHDAKIDGETGTIGNVTLLEFR